MWSNFLKVANRKFWNSKSSTFTKLFSLSIGIVCVFYIAIYIQQELSFDKFHSNYSKIAKINTKIQSPTGDILLGLSAAPVGPYIKSQAAEVEDFVRINKEYGTHTLKVEDRLFSESENIFYADPSFFRVFDFKLLYGEATSALEGPDKIILTRTTALKYFGKADVLNEILEYDGEPFLVSGVLQDLPSSSHLQFDFLVSMDTFMKSRLPEINDNWTWFPMNTYLLLSRNGKLETVERQLQLIPQYQEVGPTNDQYHLTAESFDGYHFTASKLGDLGTKGKLANLYLLLAIGIMILLLAVFNFVNLTTAQVTLQEKEVAVKKTIGASKSDIFRQFFVESILLTTLATLTSVIVVFLTFSYFQEFLGTRFEIGYLLNPWVLMLILFLPLILAMMAGIYPAFKFANISTTPTTKTSDQRFSIFNTRTGLLIFQFSITSALVIGSLIIYYQLNYIQNRDLGIETAQKIVLDYGPNSEIGTSYEVLQQELSQISGIQNVTFSSHVPGQVPNGVATQLLDISGRSSNGEINLNLVDHNFVKNYGLEIVAGRDFRAGAADQNSALILNEAAVKAFGYDKPEAILGASFEQWGGNGEVIGVVKDFNYLSLHQDIGLLSLKIWPEQFMKITLEISDATFAETLDMLKEKWELLYPGIPFNHYFVEDNFRAQYDKDKQFAGIINIFTLISICIGILGLIAYSKFWCERRRKEMSIRKVLGADISRLVWKLYSGFSLPVLIGFLLAIPISYYLGRQWLQEFAYRFDLSWHFFIVPLFILLIFVWIAVGVQTIKLALVNPVEHLNEE